MVKLVAKYNDGLNRNFEKTSCTCQDDNDEGSNKIGLGVRSVQIFESVKA